MIHCDHPVCNECFVDHYSAVLEEKSIKHFNCLICGEPDILSETIDMDLYLQLFSGLIQAHMSKDQYDLFTQKLNEWTMMKDPKFLWCIKVSVSSCIAICRFCKDIFNYVFIASCGRQSIC